MDQCDGELVGALDTPDGEIAAFVTARPDGYWYYLAGITRAGVPIGPYPTFQAATAAGLADRCRCVATASAHTGQPGVAP